MHSIANAFHWIGMDWIGRDTIAMDTNPFISGGGVTAEDLVTQQDPALHRARTKANPRPGRFPRPRGQANDGQNHHLRTCIRRSIIGVLERAAVRNGCCANQREYRETKAKVKSLLEISLFCWIVRVSGAGTKLAIVDTPH